MKSQLGGTKSHLRMDDLDIQCYSQHGDFAPCYNDSVLEIDEYGRDHHPEATVASIELGVSQEVYEVYLDAIASP